MICKNFDPIIGIDPKVLILGSMPGKVSLSAQQYYAHPRNAFWPIMSDLGLCDKHSSYQDRCDQLVSRNIALWDAIAQCRRSSSLDSDIASASIQISDIPSLLRAHCSITTIACNGKKSHQQTLKILEQAQATSGFDYFSNIEIISLSSTSPANAITSYSEKRAQFKKALSDIL